MTVKPALSCDNDADWTAVDWLWAAVIPAVFFAFEALTIANFAAMRVPNMGIAPQIMLWASFYGVWIVVPWLIWQLVPSNRFDLADESWAAAVRNLALLAVLTGAAHLAILTAILRLMHAPPGGIWSDYLHSYLETLLGRAPIWLLAFGVAVGVIVGLKRKRLEGSLPPARIELRDRGRTRLVELDDIIWIEACGNYVEYHTSAGTVLARQSLRSVREQLAKASFLHAHRSALVNARHVKAIRPGDVSEAYCVVLSNGDEAPLSRRNLAAFRTAITTGSADG